MKKVITKSDYQNFIDVLSMLKGNCVDVDISKGKIRQFSDNMMFIFEADLTNIFNDSDIVLPMLDNKLPLLSMFVDNYNDNDIILNIDNGKYTFSDGITDLSFVTMSSKEYLDNKYISDNDFSGYINFDGKTIFSQQLSKNILNKINICSNNFNVQDIQIVFNNNLAELQLFSFNMTNSAKIIGNINTQNINKNCKEIFSVKPFRIDFNGDIDFKVFYNGDSEEKVINQITSNNNNMNINIYAPGILAQN